MGRTRCEYDADLGVTRFVALKNKHEELQHRVNLFEELFRLLSMRSAAESVEIMRRMRTANIETDLEDLEDLVKFIKNAGLLMQLASAQSDRTASGESGVDTHLPIIPLDDVSSHPELLKPAVSKLDASARTVLLDTIRHDVFTSHENGRSGSAEIVKPEGMPDGAAHAEMDRGRP
ncbi:hypothetical protein LY76DRAFT_598555 [Colletotrichum caudatum]|nr:hypothetical protein LY76DRAFT_598555 [Colletotrichum caudatum]